MGIKAFTNRVNKIKDIEKQIKELQAVVDELKDELKQEMDATGQDEVVAGDFTVRYKTVENNRFDTKAFKAEHGKLYDKFFVRGFTKKFTIC